MATSRTDSTCKNRREIDDICIHTLRSLSIDELTNDHKRYIAYYCSFTDPMLRCPCYVSDKIIDLSTYGSEEESNEDDRILEKRLIDKSKGDVL